MVKSIIESMGVSAIRLTNTRGNYRPHVFLSFDKHVFAVDTSRTFKKDPVQPDAYLITHAHSDHNGKSAMLSQNAVSALAGNTKAGHSGRAILLTLTELKYPPTLLTTPSGQLPFHGRTNAAPGYWLQGM